MPIIGIDYSKCTVCRTCLTACPRYLYQENEENAQIIFVGTIKRCVLCGQCIAQCPEEAILYEGMGEAISVENVGTPEKIVTYEKAYNFLASLRSIRRYKTDKVPDELLKKVIRAMEYAATGANMRSEKFFIVSDKSKLKELSDAVIEEMVKDQMLNDQFNEQIRRHRQHYQYPIYFDAPHVIFVSSNLNIMTGGFNIGNIVTFGRLAAQSLGLGTCWSGWTQLAIERNKEIKKIVKIKGIVVAAFTIGFPDLTYYRIPPRSPKRVKGL
jgi:nitroreductase/NAD-dependent dihydropyrimidine dehydrogenase PreA subunit